jgi:glycosyltransferase involved in cell wall biosynthesis
MTKPPSTFHLPPSTSNLKVAIVHDWIVGGGAEKVILELHKMYPGAPIYTSYCTDEWRKKLNGKVVTGYLQNWPFNKLRKFLPLLRQWWFARLDLSGYDVIISSSGNGEAKFARKSSSKQIHVCYCHTPTHFYWRHYRSYLQNPGFGPKPLVRFALKKLVEPLRKRDFQAAQKVDKFIANSTHIQGDIKKYYKRDAIVIHPPVDTNRFSQLTTSNFKAPQPRSGFVTMGRQVPQKKFGLIIAACNELQLPLTVIGRGPAHSSLKSMAGSTITFKTNVTDEQMPAELAKAKAFIFAAEEDFGISPVEAMATGTPVIAYQAGGALDYVVPGKTGEFFEQQSVASLSKVLKNFKPKLYDPATIKKHAQLFSIERFQIAIQKYLTKSS